MLLELQVGNLIEPFSDRRWDRTEIKRQVARRIIRFQARELQPGDRVFLPFGSDTSKLDRRSGRWRHPRVRNNNDRQ
jgi:hypothetical protein